MEAKQGYAVLILDHGTDACNSVATILKQQGYVAERVHNLEEARAKLKVQTGILLWHLPDEAFDKWLEKGRQLLNDIEAPIVFTVDTIDDERFQAIQSCNRYGFLRTDSNQYNILQTLHYAKKMFEMRHFEQQKIELNTLATSFSAATGKQLFDNICRHLVELLQVDGAFIGEIIGQNKKIKIHSFFEEDDFRDPFEYSVVDTPSENLLKNDVCVFKSGIRQDYPNDERLQQWGIEGYIGVPLLSSSGKTLGVAVLLNKSSIKDEHQCKQYLQIYSDRVSAEMERLHAEAELRDREQELRSINEHISEGIYRSTPKDGLIYVNEAFATMFGYDSPEELLSLEGAKLYANEERRKRLTEVENTYGYIKNEEVEFQRKDGSTFWGLMSGKVVQGEEGAIKYYDGSVLDITERKFAIEENRRLLKAIQQSPVSILITDAKGYIEYVNPCFLEETDSREEELLGVLAPMLEQNKVNEPFYEDMWEVIKSGDIWSGTIRKSKNQEVSWDKVTISPVLDDNGEITNYVIIHKDITERKARENKLQQSLSEKEILLAEIHHRVKNNLAIISGLLNLAAVNSAPNQVNNIFHESQMRIQSMAMVHEKLYQAGNFTNLKMGSYVAELVDSIRDTLSQDQKEIDINIDNEVEARLNINQAIPCALMINELVTNAFKYAYRDRESGKLDIRLQSKGENICLIVEDDGPGLPSNFEENEDPDTLGFVLIRQLTKQLEGELNVKNGNGARFEILFRRSDHAGSSSAGYIIDQQKK